LFFDEDQNILFNVKWFPNPETVFNSFDSELWFYKKGESYHLNLTGIANITIADKVLVKFSITHIECLGTLPEEDTSLHSRFMSFIKNILNFENAAKNFRLS